MTNKYQILINFIKANSGKDGIHTDAITLSSRTGVSLKTVYLALKYFNDNKIFDVVKFGNGYLILNDISTVEHFDVGNTRYYQTKIRLVMDDVRYEPVTEMQPTFELSFNGEGA